MTINKNIELPTKPSEKIEVSDVFKIDSKMSVKRFKEKLNGFQKLMMVIFLIKKQHYQFWQALVITEEL